MNSPSVWNYSISGAGDVSHGNCTAPLIAWVPLDESLSEGTTEWISRARLCFSGCCVPCKNYINVSPHVRQLENSVIILESIVFVLSFLTLVNYLISSKLVVNNFAGFQSFAFMILSTSLSIGQINLTVSDRCYDIITPISGYESSRCMAQGVLYVLGSHLMSMALSFRIFAVLIRIVWGKIVPKRYLLIIACGIGGLFAGMSSKWVSYQGGIICSPDPAREISMVKVPVLVYSISGLLILVGLSGYVSNTLYHISLNVRQSRMPTEYGSEVRLSTKIQLGLMAYLRSVRLLWRTYVCASFLTTMVVCGLLFIFPESGDYHPPHEMTVSVYLNCAEQEYDEKQCLAEQFDKGEQFYREKMISIIVIAVQLILFILTEWRFIVFRLWYNIFKNPALIIQRKQLGEMIEEIISSLEQSKDEKAHRNMCSLSEPDTGQANWFSRYREAKEFRDFEQQLATHRRTMEKSFIQHHCQERKSSSVTDKTSHRSGSIAEMKNKAKIVGHKSSNPDPIEEINDITNDQPTNDQNDENAHNDDTNNQDLDIMQFLQTSLK